MLDNDVLIALGNGTVRDLVVTGEMSIGLTDTDDVASAMGRGDPVGMIFPDGGEDGEGTLVIPNTVAMLAGCPHRAEARALIDYLLSARVEERLAKCPSAQIPLRPGVPGGGVTPALDEIKAVTVDYTEVAGRAEGVADYLRKSFR
jgi:iron(III) transport system substrate-binding protein